MTEDTQATQIAPGTDVRPTPTREAPGPTPSIVIHASKGWRALNLRELWEYRELLYFFVWKDVKVRYKQTVLGIAWAVLQPILMTFVFYLIFTRLAQLSTLNQPPIIFYLSGLIPWNLFARGLSEASMSLAENQILVTKVYFPRILLPVAAVLSALVDFALSLVVLAVLMIYYDVVPAVTLLMLPVFLFVAIVAAIGISLWFSALNVKYRDVRYTIPFLTQLLLFATPVAYASIEVPESFRLIYSLNPMVSVVQGFRWALFDGAFAFDLGSWLSVAVVVAVFVSGLFYFRRAERTFADVV